MSCQTPLQAREIRKKSHLLDVDSGMRPGVQLVTGPGAGLVRY
jgi:hypothetical protein